MKQNLLAFFMVGVLLIGSVYAQDRRISGTVTSTEDGSSLPGVSVTVVGTNIGTQTGIDGSYSLSVPADATALQFSFIGFTSQTVTIGNRTTVNVNLASDAQQLSEVVVVGYGTQRRTNVTTSIVGVQSDVLEDIPAADVSSALQGRMAGVQVTSGSGRPGAPIAVNIRGRSSINAGNNPLFVVDGVILADNSTTTPNTAGAGVSAFANLNPEDIESIDVLKDAAAAAIYGSRGSNGVVLITTKRGGRGDKSVINLSTYTGFQSLTKTKDVLNASEYRSMYNEALVNGGLPALFTDEQVRNPENNVDWVDEVLNDNSRIENINLSITSGGNQKTQFYSSLNYFKQDGALKRGGFKRFSFRTNVTHEINDIFTLGTNMAVSKTLRDETETDNSIYSPFPRAMIARPDQSIFNEDGSYADNDFYNPVHMFQSDNFVNLSNIFNSTYLEAKILPSLRFRSAIGIDYSYLDQRTYDPTTSLSGSGSNGAGSSGYVQTQNIITTQTLSFNDDFFDDRLNVDGTAVYEFQWNDRENNRVDGSNYPSDLTPYVISAAQITGGTAAISQFRIESLLARVNLAWDSKYLFGASIRRDGSSRIPKDGRYGYFPSVSGGWIISEEDFFGSFAESSTIDYLKIRASYGETGNQAGIGNYESRRLIGSGYNYNDQPGLALNALGSPNLRWESTKQFDIGLEFAFLRDRINVSADYYKKKTEDLLLNRPIPSTTGFRTILENIGNIEGSGFDFQINSRNFVGDFRWNTSLNISTYNNEVTELFNDQSITGAFVTRHAVGQPLGAFYLEKALGVDPETGDMIYEDIDGSSITNDNRQFLGSPVPKLYGGISNDFAFRNFDLGVFFQYSYGNKVYNMNAEGVGGYESLGGNASATAVATNVLKDVYDNRWTPENRNAEYPRAVAGAAGITNNKRSSRYLEDGSYLRLKNITLGYTLPKSLLSTVGLNNARIYITGQNILTFTKYTGFDPEVSTENEVDNFGVDQGSIPQFKTYTIGINIGI